MSAHASRCRSVASGPEPVAQPTVEQRSSPREPALSFVTIIISASIAAAVAAADTIVGRRWPTKPVAKPRARKFDFIRELQLAEVEHGAEGFDELFPSQCSLATVVADASGRLEPDSPSRRSFVAAMSDHPARPCISFWS